MSKCNYGAIFVILGQLDDNYWHAVYGEFDCSSQGINVLRRPFIQYNKNMSIRNTITVFRDSVHEQSFCCSVNILSSNTIYN